MTINTIDRFYCINLDHQVERWCRVITQSNYFGLDIKRFSAIKKNDDRFYRGYAYGCRLSFYNCMKQARDTGYNRICILEDDFVLHRDFVNKSNYYISLLDKEFKGWDIFHCGHSIRKRERTKNKEIDVVKHHWSNVCSFYNLNENFDNYIENIMDASQKYYFEGTDTIFSHLSRQKLLTIYTPKKNNLICVQNDGYSDIVGRNMKKIGVYGSRKDFLFDILENNDEQNQKN